MTNACELNGVTKRYGPRRALAGLDLAIPAGTVFGLVGSNGAGKTTTLSIAAGLVRQTSGSVNLLGAGPFRAAVHAGRVTLLPQSAALPEYATPRELLELYGRLQTRGPSRTARAAADRALDWVGMSERRDSPIRTLSHGMVRRVALAQAFLGEPDLLLLDEPFSGLDPREVARLRDLLRGRREGKTLVVSSHNLHEIEEVCDQVAFVDAGRVVRRGALAAVTRRHRVLRYRLAAGDPPLETLRARLAGATFELSPDKAQLTVTLAEQAVSPAEANATVVPVLFQAGVQLLEIRIGSSLEREYLAGLATDAG
ncbi:MAG: ABC transporter ATP-binding protein [Kiritimatiellae bacterium]|nr:ABC transporter ATP-binding protein [Kiritimatiellia bacterium]